MLNVISLDKVNFETPRKEVYRYLGYRKNAPDENAASEIETCIADLEACAAPRGVYERFPLETGNVCRDRSTGGAGAGDTVLYTAGLEIRSRDLARNLKGCTAVYILAVTIGPGPDMLVKRAEVGGVYKAAVYQAAGAAMAEEWCNIVNKMIIDEAAKDGLAVRPRFSPGYGDLSLELQTGISRILNMPKNIGVNLLDSLLMTPTKSITAFAGVGKI